MPQKHHLAILLDLLIDRVQVRLERGVDGVDVRGVGEAAVLEGFGTRAGCFGGIWGQVQERRGMVRVEGLMRGSTMVMLGEGVGCRVWAVWGR